MAQSRYRFFETCWNPYLVHNQKGFPTTNLENLFSGKDDISYKIPLEFEYRPDLISQRFYGNSKFFWVIVYANGFNNSPQDFIKNAVIKIPKYERVVALL